MTLRQDKKLDDIVFCDFACPAPAKNDFTVNQTNIRFWNHRSQITDSVSLGRIDSLHWFTGVPRIVMYSDYWHVFPIKKPPEGGWIKYILNVSYLICSQNNSILINSPLKNHDPLSITWFISHLAVLRPEIHGVLHDEIKLWYRLVRFLRWWNLSSQYW